MGEIIHQMTYQDLKTKGHNISGQSETVFSI